MALKRKVLIDEIEALEKEQQELISAIKRIDNKENFETIKHFTYLYRKAFYRKLPFDFIDTVFHSQKNILQKHANGCFIEKVLDVAFDSAKRFSIDELVMDIPMYCKDIIQTDKGISFILTDPYRTIATLSMSRITEKSAEVCKGRMIIAQIVIPENHRAITAFELKGYRLLKMNLTNILGKTPSTTEKLFTQFKDVKSEFDAINAINIIENHFKGMKNTIICRENELYIRILTDTYLIAVNYGKGKLWYAKEPSDQLIVCQSIKESKDYNSAIRYCFAFEDELKFPVY